MIMKVQLFKNLGNAASSTEREIYSFNMLILEKKGLKLTT